MAASADTNWFMNAPPIQGDGITGYTNQVALNGFGQPIEAEASTGSAPAKPILENAFMHLIADGGITQIFKTLVHGTIIPTVTISGLKTIGGKPQPFAQFTYTNVYLTGLSLSMGDSELIVDNLQFNFTNFTFEYWEETNGTLKSIGQTHYDVLNQIAT